MIALVFEGLRDNGKKLWRTVRVGGRDHGLGPIAGSGATERVETQRPQIYAISAL
jgi:hypothetical protein